MKLAPLLSAAWLAVSTMPGAAEVIERQQSVRPLPGGLDSVLMVNDNNPELIDDDGILISTFRDGKAASVPVVLNGRFDLFSHHVYAGDAEGSPSSTLWLAVLAAPLGNAPVTLQLLSGSTSLSQATGPGQTQAPFLPLPSLMPETTDVVASGSAREERGPGSGRALWPARAKCCPRAAAGTRVHSPAELQAPPATGLSWGFPPHHRRRRGG